MAKKKTKAKPKSPKRAKATKGKKPKTKTVPSKKAKAKTHLRHSKTANFIDKIRNNSMVDYFTQLRILNPAATLKASLNEPRREGGFVRLAHANEEFTAPVLSKGKSVTPPLTPEERRAEKTSGSPRTKKKSSPRK